ncbi:MAG TPA: HAD family hydrolase [Chloroflexi bacterium]|nr:HAD family hydrolase [Chloroflexota bacterium]
MQRKRRTMSGDITHRIAALFDLDGTLYTGHITLGVARHNRIRRANRLELFAYMAVHMPMWWLLKIAGVSESTLRGLWTRNLGWTVRGWTIREAEEAFSWITEQYVMPRVRPEILARLREHQSFGHRVILISGSFSPLLETTGRHLGVQETVGTPLAIQDGRYTGASELPVCQGAGKVARLENYLNGTGEIYWPESYAYADSYTDLPLLEKVGHPVAVYPDQRLSAHAISRGWEIIL